MDNKTVEEKLVVELKEVVYANKDPDNLAEKKLEAEGSGDDNNTFLYFSALTADILIFSAGCGFTWSSPVFPQLAKADPEINPLGAPVTAIQESWIASLYCLGAAIGPLFAGKLADKLGRKKIMLIIALPKILALMLLAFATDVHVYYLTRFTMGLTVGSSFAIVPMYLTEISELHNKGKVGCLMTVVLTFGTLYPFVVGPYLSIKLFTFSCAIPLMLFMIFFTLFIPESPVFLVSQGKYEEAEAALMQLRNRNHYKVKQELMYLKTVNKSSEKSAQGVGQLFKDIGLRKAFIISIGLLISQQVAGINAVLAFLDPIFQASGSGISTYLSTVLIGLVQIIGTVVAAAVVEKLGRRILLLASSVGSCFSLVLLGFYFYVKKSGTYDIDSLFWLPVTSLMTYIMSFNIGLGGLPWTVSNEIFPSNIQATASSLASFCCFMASFSVTLVFPILVNAFGMAQSFWLFAGCLVFVVLFIYTIVPETKGRTAAEIQQRLRGE